MAQEIHCELGLTDEEYDRIKGILGRPPNHLELALYAVMWSEHCSYKSSRIHLKRLPTKGDRVLVGPGENAGVIDAGDGIGIAMRIESHNHPSAIEPHQGAATGVGGILRDIFTMGARPLATMDPLFFGNLEEDRQRWLLHGVVSGIANYGNSVGVPNVGGELTFDPCYAGNPLVNVLCMGALPIDRLVLGRASGPGNLAVLLGSKTGRDGIGGVSVLASAGFEQTKQKDGLEHDSKRPSVQVGDPFEEKRLIEACLALLDEGLVIGIQDLGGAGLACATSETAARGGVGMDVDVLAVLRREPNMEPFEVMTSESQERMLAIVSPTNLPRVEALCLKWDVAASVIGRITEPTENLGDQEPSGRLRIMEGFDGEVLADVPAKSLADEAPLYDRPIRRPLDLDARIHDDPTDDEPQGNCGEEILALLCDPGWVYRQYDHQLFLNSVVTPGGDAALLRLGGPGLPKTARGVALSTDSNPKAGALDPSGAAQLILAESVLNLACVGARAEAVVNCMNMGNPEHPEVMWQLGESIDGLSEACRALDLPVIGGNVSLYNETRGVDIDPTLVLGVVGLLESLFHPPPGLGFIEGAPIYLLGKRGDRHLLGASQWAVRIRTRSGGEIPCVDWAAHIRLVDLVANLVAAQVGKSNDRAIIGGVHDISAGGLGVALSEMAMASGIGAHIKGIADHRELFCELPSRVVVSTKFPDVLEASARSAGVACVQIGTAHLNRLIITGRDNLLVDVSLSSLLQRSQSALKDP